MEKDEVLDSWKEISAYLNRSVMTCHRWEQELGLPVHRLDGSPKARVFAYTAEIDRWKAEMLHSSETGKKARLERLKKALLAAGALVALTGLVVLGRAVIRPSLLPVPVQVPSLAVLPFENRTGDGSLDAWKTALADLIMIDLGQSRFLSVVTTTQLNQALAGAGEADKPAPEALRKTAEAAGADYMLTGNLKLAGQDIVITVQVQDPRLGEITATPRSVRRSEKGFFAAVDDLSREVKSALNLTPRQVRRDVDERAAGITTSSPQAFKLYSQGYRLQGLGKINEAVTPLREAVEIDPEFGLAYRLLYHVCRGLSREVDTDTYGRKAAGLSGRIAARDRYTFLADYFRFHRKDRKSALRAYQRLRALYPYDAGGGLAEHYMDQEEWGQAIPIWEALLLRNSRHEGAIQRLSTCYQALGSYDRAETILDGLLNAGPRFPPTVWMRRLNVALARGEFAVAHGYADKLLSYSPDNLGYLARKGDIFFTQDDLDNAEAIFRRIVERQDAGNPAQGHYDLARISLSRGRVEQARSHALAGIDRAERIKNAGPFDRSTARHGHYLLAYLERLSGRLPEALKEAEEACRGCEEEGVGAVRELHLRALINLELGRLDEFEKQAAGTLRFTDPDRFTFPSGFPRLKRVYHHLLGHRELRKKDYASAIRHFWRALDLLSVHYSASADADHTKYFYSLAEAYRLSGDRQNALEMYEKAVLPSLERGFSGDIHALSYYQMGLENESRLGFLLTPEQKAAHRFKAVANYRKFLELWGGADPRFTEVEDARARLARLLSE